MHSTEYNDWARGGTQTWTGQILGSCWHLPLHPYEYPRTMALRFAGAGFADNILVSLYQIIFSKCEKVFFVLDILKLFFYILLQYLGYN